MLPKAGGIFSYIWERGRASIDVLLFEGNI